MDTANSLQWSKLVPFFSDLVKNEFLQNKLLENSLITDPWPVVKVDTFDGHNTWLLTKMKFIKTFLGSYATVEALTMFNRQWPEMVTIRLSDLDKCEKKYRLSLVKDSAFNAEYPISIYAYAANLRSEITTDKDLLKFLSSSEKIMKKEHSQINYNLK